jgi:hypothetical protein
LLGDRTPIVTALSLHELLGPPPCRTGSIEVFDRPTLQRGGLELTVRRRLSEALLDRSGDPRHGPRLLQRSDPLGWNGSTDRSGYR